MQDFPSFSEGLSLRGKEEAPNRYWTRGFPFLFGGTFIEGRSGVCVEALKSDFPSFSEGLSLRAHQSAGHVGAPLFPFLFGGTFIEGRLF